MALPVCPCPLNGSSPICGRQLNDRLSFLLICFSCPALVQWFIDGRREESKSAFALVEQMTIENFFSLFYFLLYLLLLLLIEMGLQFIFFHRLFIILSEELPAAIAAAAAVVTLVAESPLSVLNSFFYSTTLL